MVGILIERDLVRRNPGAARASGFWLTDHGTQVHNQFQAQRQRIAREYVGVLNTGEQLQLHDLLQKLKAALGGSTH